MNQRPNILLITERRTRPLSHRLLRASPYRNATHGPPRTEGTTFDNAYTACPICVPARMSFMTGQYVHQIGTWDNGSPLAGTIPTMGSYLEAAGYETAACGRTHFIGPERLARLWQTPHGRRRKMETLEYGCPPRAHPTTGRGSNSHVTECGPGENWQIDYDSNSY